ncbi:hypothetical protein PF004_g32374, partial [Phytophthora fragariae]
MTTAMTTMLLCSAVMVFRAASARRVTSCVRASRQVYATSGTLPTGNPRYRDSLVTAWTCSGDSSSSFRGIAAGFNAMTSVLLSLRRSPDARANSRVISRMIATSRTV